LPEEALRFRTAWGHLPGPDGVPTLVERWALPRSTGPAGGVAASAQDMLAVAQTLLHEGRAPTGERVLSPELVREMLSPQSIVPDRWLGGGHWGLGVRLSESAGRRTFGHDGTGCGQCAFLVAVPDRDTAVVVLTNSDSVDLGLTLIDELLLELCDLPVVAWPEPLPNGAARPSSVPSGTYERHGMRLVLVPDGARVGARLTVGPELTDEPGPEQTLDLPLEPSTAGPDVYVTRVPGSERRWAPVVFFERDGEPYVHFGGRALHPAAAGEAT
jgi:hypothetical protein